MLVQELCKALGVRTKRSKPHLSLAQWVAAFDRYALASVLTGQWSMTTALVATVRTTIIAHLYARIQYSGRKTWAAENGVIRLRPA